MKKRAYLLVLVMAVLLSAFGIDAAFAAEGEYMVISEIAPIMESPGGQYKIYEEYGTVFLEYSQDISGVVVYGNKLKLRPEKDWFALLSPEDGGVLGYIPGDAVAPFPDFEPTNGALYMASRDNPGLSLVPDGANKLPNDSLSLLKGEVVPSLGRRDGKIILSFGSLEGADGVGGRYAWADEKDFIALASYEPDNTKADRALIPSARRLNAWGDDSEKFEELPGNFIDSLEKRGFLIDDEPILPKYGVSVDDMADLYRATRNYEADFITADIFLHSFHLIFDQMLQKFERTYMTPRLAENLSETLGFLGTAARHIDGGGYAEQAFDAAYDMLTVARALLLGNPEPFSLSPAANAEIEKIMAASEMAVSEITGQIMDYTQFKPRGHYTLSPEFERYFRAMNYLGLAELPLFDKGKSITRNVAAAAIISLALDSNIAAWEKFEDSMNFLVGVPNAGDPKLYREIVRNRLGEGGADTWRLLGDEAVMAGLAKDILDNMPGPKIQSVVEIDEEGSNFEDRFPVFRIAPKRFTYDAYIMNWLTSPRVGTDYNPRNLPKGIDVMAVFGSPVADELSKKDYGIKNYEANLARLKGEVAGYLANENTVYASWLEAFRAGFEDSGSDQFFYRSGGWQWKKLATNLASWAELKRDTILYAEQSMAEMGDGGDWYAGRFDPPRPRGYVEPDPQFFEAMLDATGYLGAFITEYGVEDNDDEDETTYSERLGKFSQMLASMRDIARKQVAKETLSPGEYDAIKETARAFDGSLLLPGRDSAFTIDDGELRKMAVVADAATNGFDMMVLEVGVGVPRAIYVFANDKSGGARVTKGYVFSYYEFEHPMANRLTDQEWRAIVYDPDRAEELEKYRPDWHGEFKQNTQ